MKPSNVLLALLLPVAVLLAAPTEAAPGGKAKGKARRGGAAGSEDVEKLRALPYVDFVEDETGEVKTGVTIAEEGRYKDGYLLFTNRGLCRVDLMDPAGTVINTWLRTPCHHWAHAELSSEGDLLVVSLGDLEGADNDSFDLRRSLLRFSWDGRVLMEAGGKPHHAFDVLSDGRIVILTADPRLIPSFNPKIPVRDEKIAIMSPQGSILEEQSLFDLLTAAGDLFEFKKTATRRKRLGAVDAIHSNAVEWMPFQELAGHSPAHLPSAILVTLRHQNALIAVDWETRKIVWAWGPDELRGPHDGTWLKNGNVLVFDNGLSRRWSRVLEVDPRSGEIVWEYKAPNPKDLFARTNGAAQRLPGGNTLITDSTKGRAFEVTPGGEVVWKYVNPRRGGRGRRSAIIKMMSLPAAYVEKARRSAGGEAR